MGALYLFKKGKTYRTTSSSSLVIFRYTFLYNIKTLKTIDSERTKKMKKRIMMPQTTDEMKKEMEKERILKKEMKTQRLINSILLNCTIGNSRHFVIEERVDENGISFVLVCNFFLKESCIFETLNEALIYLCNTTCYIKRFTEQYLNDIDLLVDTFNESNGRTIQWM